MAVSPRIHWVNLSFLPVLDVLPRGPAQVEADYIVVGLHPRSDGAESGVVDGGDAGDAVCGLKGHQRRFPLNCRTIPRESPAYCAARFECLASSGRCKTAIGFSDPRNVGTTSSTNLAGIFCLPYRVMAAVRGRPSGSTGFLGYRFANPRTAATSPCLATCRGGFYFRT